VGLLPIYHDVLSIGFQNQDPNLRWSRSGLRWSVTRLGCPRRLGHPCTGLVWAFTLLPLYHLSPGCQVL